MEKSKLIPLAEELATFEAHKAELLGRHRGGFALIHGEDILGTYDTQQDAIKVGYSRLGNVPFLTREIVETETSAKSTRDIFITPQVEAVA